MSDEDDPTFVQAEDLIESMFLAYEQDKLSVVAATLNGAEVHVLCIAVDANNISPVAVLMNDALIPHVHPYGMAVIEPTTDGDG